jgi:hypothetical protein
MRDQWGRGRTPNQYAGQLVRPAVMDITDLPIVANEIRVCSESPAGAKGRSRGRIAIGRENTARHASLI